jgi:hypothetical protein
VRHNAILEVCGPVVPHKSLISKSPIWVTDITGA